jgi:hypothetical protein
MMRGTLKRKMLSDKNKRGKTEEERKKKYG